MQTEYCKEREELFSPPQASCLWNIAFGPPALTTESLSSDSFPGVKVVTQETGSEQGVDKAKLCNSFTLQNNINVFQGNFPKLIFRWWKEFKRSCVKASCCFLNAIFLLRVWICSANGAVFLQYSNMF